MTIPTAAIDESMIERLVRAFYARVQADPLLGPIFAAKIVDWEPHLLKLIHLWSSIALPTARYGGRPMQTHVTLDVGPEHLTMAEMIARSLKMGIDLHRPRKTG